MMHLTERKVVSGPALIRLLARLTDAGVPASGQPLADRLCEWLAWTDAIALSSALSGGAHAGAPRDLAPDHSQDAACMQVRTSLTNAIARHAALAPQRQRGHARNRQDHATADTAPDYTVFRQCYLSLQEEMATAIGHLRTRLRGMLTARAGAGSRLASVDAVMERVLGIREHNALAAVPGLLAVHFERLRDAQLAMRDDEAAAQQCAQNATSSAMHAPASPTLHDGPWLDVFRKDMQGVLFAELEIRFQPVEGLRAALRAC